MQDQQDLEYPIGTARNWDPGTSPLDASKNGEVM